MNDNEIIIKIKKALDKLITEDQWLLDHDLSEQSISHKLAVYIQENFTDYNVDCEYNGNVDDGGGRKHINLIYEELNKMGLLKESETDLDSELVRRAVLPDIIVHIRGSNQHNLCIVEVKKSTSTVSQDYDYLKVHAYTGLKYENTLLYQLGILILFNIGNMGTAYTLSFFKNGEQVVI